MLPLFLGFFLRWVPLYCIAIFLPLWCVRHFCTTRLSMWAWLSRMTFFQLTDCCEKRNGGLCQHRSGSYDLLFSNSLFSSSLFWDFEASLLLYYPLLFEGTIPWLLFEVGTPVLYCNLCTTLVCSALLYHSSEHVGLVESDDFLPVD